jgi:hypothetical protein
MGFTGYIALRSPTETPDAVRHRISLPKLLFHYFICWKYQITQLGTIWAQLGLKI